MKHFAILAGLLLAFGTTMGAQTTEKTTIKGGKGNLAAVIQKPKMKEGEKVRVAIICHGFTGYKEETLLCHIADSLQQAGIASIRFDFNGHGASEGTLQEMTVQNELEDARRVVAYALEQPWVTDVSLVGHSQGAWSARCSPASWGMASVPWLFVHRPPSFARMPSAAN